MAEKFQNCIVNSVSGKYKDIITTKYIAMRTRRENCILDMTKSCCFSANRRVFVEIGRNLLRIENRETVMKKFYEKWIL